MEELVLALREKMNYQKCKYKLGTNRVLHICCVNDQCWACKDTKKRLVLSIIFPLQICQFQIPEYSVKFHTAWPVALWASGLFHYEGFTVFAPGTCRQDKHPH